MHGYTVTFLCAQTKLWQKMSVQKVVKKSPKRKSFPLGGCTYKKQSAVFEMSK